MRKGQPEKKKLKKVYAREKILHLNAVQPSSQDTFRKTWFLSQLAYKKKALRSYFLLSSFGHSVPKNFLFCSLVILMEQTKY